MRRSSATLTVALVTLAALSGCGEDVGSGDASLALGTGSWRYEALEDGDTVELVRGAQGGWHVWLSVRTRGIDERQVVQARVQPADESRPPTSDDLRVSLDPMNDDGTRDLIGYPLVIEDPSCLVGEMIRIEVRTEVGGEMVRTERDVRVDGGTYPPDPC